MADKFKKAVPISRSDFVKPAVTFQDSLDISDISERLEGFSKIDNNIIASSSRAGCKASLLDQGGLFLYE